MSQKVFPDYGTADVQERIFCNTTIKPLQDQRAEIITEEVVYAMDLDFTFVFNEPDFANRNELRRAALDAQACGILDDNEVRTWFFGMEARQEEDEPDQAPAAPASPQEESDEASPAPVRQNQKGTRKTRSRPTETEADVIVARRKTQQNAGANHLSPNSSATSTVRSSAHPWHDRPQAPQESLLGDFIDDLLLEEQTTNQQLQLLMQSDLTVAARTRFAEAGLRTNLTFVFASLAPILAQYLNTERLTRVRGINDTPRKLLRATLLEGYDAARGPTRSPATSVLSSPTPKATAPSSSPATRQAWPSPSLMRRPPDARVW